ncbi:MAG: 3-methylcrotonyl-CoA carboxylase alpha subunit [Hyphomicrobiales bacterium]|jgi:3-methylcrotonyl-CoA carboxylase alpha subunit|nr:3-methylcrotonyl-CoA carboxylase alpha subunit [Hyphomicrobiales bacterium]
MFSSVLIANRGEIAVRVARTAKRLGMRVIAVYSEADAGALHVRVADEAHLIGPPPARESYLVIEKLIETARRSGAQCIHPGYGFLSENAAFAEACAAAGIVFVGPPPSAIRAMGLKDRAKALMEKAGVPVVPGYHGELQEAKFLKEKAYQIGYPVLIKAVAGGGGKGMRRVDKHAEFDAALEGAMREAQSAFGDARVLIEKYVTAPRHIEMQVFADSHGNVIHLNERDCSLQRRHQKVIEEAPAPGMTAGVRAAMGRAATEAARAVGYQGAGTVEFIADGARGLRPDGFWFMEMNTRLQVEHPVTEAITGLDLVEMQFRVAAGETLPLAQSDVRIDGHAAEARLYAEDPERGFLPSTGRLAALELPAGEGIRVDTGVDAGSAISPYYDPMIAKVIAHGSDRAQALARLATALGETVVVGPHANAAFLEALVSHPEFRAGQFDTGFIDRHLAELTRIDPQAEATAIGAGVAALLAPTKRKLEETPWRDPWSTSDGFSLGPQRQLDLDIMVDGHPRKANVAWHNGAHVTVDGVPGAHGVRLVPVGSGIVVVGQGVQRHVALKSYDTVDVDHLDGDGAVKAPMHGKVLAIFVAPGASVTKGERVAVVEAMKMEHALLAPLDGTVTEVAVEVGAQLAEGAKILTIEAAQEEG